MIRSRQSFWAALFILGMATGGLAGAETSPQTLNDAALLFDSVMSPYCPGRTLSACPSDDARVLREEIVDSLSSGRSVEEERARLIEKYGDEILGTPSDSRVRVASWASPALFFVIGLFVIQRFVSRRAFLAQPNAAQPLDAEMRSRIERELSERISEKKGS